MISRDSVGGCEVPLLVSPGAARAAAVSLSDGRTAHLRPGAAGRGAAPCPPAAAPL